MSLIESMVPACEIYSIDETFCDLSGVPGSLEGLGRTMRSTILRSTGIPVGVGIARTKHWPQAGQPHGKAATATQAVWWTSATRSIAIGYYAIRLYRTATAGRNRPKAGLSQQATVHQAFQSLGSI